MIRKRKKKKGRKKRKKNRKEKKPTGFLKNVTQEDHKDCKKNNIRAEEEQKTAARTKQHEDEEDYTGIRPAGGEIREQREKHGKKNKTSKTTSVNASAFALPPLNSTKTNEN